MSKKKSGQDSTFTLIVHGTFAEEEDWWRLGNKKQKTFADLLESELAKRGKVGTVWQPALKNGFNYEAFSWSGKNKHKDRLRGAHKLRRTLNNLAEKMGATIEKPLNVNFIAHSHGGNVVLDALRRLGDKVRARSVVLLGTPLVTFSPTLRLARIIIAYVVLSLVTMFGLFAIIYLFILLLSILPSIDMPPSLIELYNIEMVLITIPMIIFYGWLFWLLATICDLFWRILVNPFIWLRRRWPGRAYGPTERSLTKHLERKPIVLFTSHHDEADILLRLGTGPRKLYQEYINRKHLLLRLPERILIRPIIDGIFFKVLELFLEHSTLGFSWLRVLFFDYEISPIDERPYFKKSLMRRIDVTEKLIPTLKTLTPMKLSPAISEQDSSNIKDRQVTALTTTLKEVGNNLKEQVKLRHSLYYQSKDVLEHIVEILVPKDKAKVKNDKN
jgi:pimeloyl-ACP methyl ester carboxylesterase